MLVFVHGLGDSGHSWQRIAASFNRDSTVQHRVEYIFPHAPVMAITAKFCMRMPAWYDVLTFISTAPEDNDDFGMLRWIASLGALGTAMTLLTGLSSERKLGGLIVLSRRLRLGEKSQAVATSAKYHDAGVRGTWQE
ncbi:uncharacterized protein C8Q71DRAFT_746138 [Rhodofomes roseus]|uniref:Acyl-protein thioesterase 1 n=1 Tax=Rhodofomes roseus TaxID=34475 RepID=A0ABQ8KPE4_9APHY|nr:uncharacterized protein C8Q71DRAFT_746138 [Rhodofomes roseus]KAH9840181.1 hypothetical protein C8Q71DRAFT_746138 [Rhodofomes roseus]